MKRRAFIKLIAGAGAFWPLAARAQKPAIPTIGYLGTESANAAPDRVREFLRGLRDNGYIEGRNVGIEYRWADGQNERLSALAADLVQRQVALITANGAAALAAKAATNTIPIVFFTGGDPVQIGLVPSLNRPGSNITGVTDLNVGVGPKRLELLRELVPSATAVGLLVNPANRTRAETVTRELETPARTLQLKLHVLNASNDRELDAAFESLTQLRLSGLVVGPDAFFASRSKRLGELAVRHAVPTIFAYREFAASGGLLSYGANNTELYRQVGIYSGRILKGEKPADLPVYQSTKVEMILNLKTAKALGINIPNTLIGRADEVIE